MGLTCLTTLPPIQLRSSVTRWICVTSHLQIFQYPESFLLAACLRSRCVCGETNVSGAMKTPLCLQTVKHFGLRTNAAFSLWGHGVSHTVGCRHDSLWVIATCPELLLLSLFWLCSSRCPQAEHQRQWHVDHHRRRWGHDSYPGALRRRQQPLQAVLHHPRPDRHLPLRSSRARLREGRGLHHQLHGWEFNVVLSSDLYSSFGHTWLDFSWYAICQQTLFST